MRTKFTVTIIFLCAVLTYAFDPVGPPPMWTLVNTCSYLAKVIRPQVSFVDATVLEALEFLRGDRPPAYTPIYEVDEALLASRTTYSIDQKDISEFEVLAKLAEKLEADLVISPGKVLLKKRSPKKATKKP